MACLRCVHGGPIAPASPARAIADRRGTRAPFASSGPPEDSVLGAALRLDAHGPADLVEGPPFDVAQHERRALHGLSRPARRWCAPAPRAEHEALGAGLCGARSVGAPETVQVAGVVRGLPVRPGRDRSIEQVHRDPVEPRPEIRRAIRSARAVCRLSRRSPAPRPPRPTGCPSGGRQGCRQHGCAAPRASGRRRCLRPGPAPRWRRPIAASNQVRRGSGGLVRRGTEPGCRDIPSAMSAV